jgi:hypothetical protein
MRARYGVRRMLESARQYGQGSVYLREIVEPLEQGNCLVDCVKHPSTLLLCPSGNQLDRFGYYVSITIIPAS